MSKNVSKKNKDRFSKLGIAITAWRRHRGMSQEIMSEKAGITTILVDRNSKYVFNASKIIPDYIVKSLNEVNSIISLLD